MTENQTAPLVLIADSHVQPNTEREDEFFSMLDWIASTNFDVFFLGDNLDLWIASGDRYEADAHRRFLAWCKREKARRRVLMVEGNHEFYLKRHHDGCFTACSETFYKIGDILFMHGDVAQKKFGFHRCFRVFAKNAFGDWVMGWYHETFSQQRWLAGYKEIGEAIALCRKACKGLVPEVRCVACHHGAFPSFCTQGTWRRQEI